MTTVFRRILLQRRHPSSRYYARRIVRKSVEESELVILPDNQRPHIPVLLKEVIRNLKLKEGNLFLDMTFGAGGHTEALLERIPSLQVFALDRDPVAIGFATELQKKYPGQVIPLEGKFSDLPELLKNYQVPPNTFDAILFDLGCSSMQFDVAERGFSILRNGPLDMRMDGGKATGELSAADVIAYASEKDLVQIFKTYGGEKQAFKITQAILQARAKYKPLKTTGELNDLIETVCGGEERHDRLQRRTKVATKVFKALRAFVNNEINELNYGILLAHFYLKPGGRAAVITFDSSEDQIAKRQFQNRLVDNHVGHLPLVYLNPNVNYDRHELDEFQPKKWDVVNKRVIIPTEEEMMMNARCRSAKLRVAVKVSHS